MRAVKDSLKRSRRALVMYHLFDNWRTKRRFAAGRMELESGATHRRMSLSESLAYVERVFQDYVEHGGLTSKEIEGTRVLEIGPGDNLGVALRFLAAGAEEVVALDRFYAPRDDEHQARIYAGLRECLHGKARARYDRACRFDGKGFRFDERRLRVVHGVGIEDARNLFPPASFDLVVSRAVFEHLYDPDAALSTIDALLRKGGRSIHKIDFRDHGMFSEYGFHPLEFLTMREGVYARMTRESGKPNRRLAAYYGEAVKRLGWKGRVLVTHLLGKEEEFIPPLHGVPQVGPGRRSHPADPAAAGSFFPKRWGRGTHGPGNRLDSVETVPAPCPLDS